MSAVPHALALNSLDTAGYRDIGEDERRKYLERASGDFDTALSVAGSRGEHEALAAIKADVQAAIEEHGITPPPALSYDGGDFLHGKLQSMPVKDAKIVNMPKAPPSGDLRELKQGLPDGVSIKQSGYSDRYRN